MAYEYDHDCPFEAFITNLGKYNEGELVGEWVKFPTTSEELQKVFERIGIGSKDDFGNPYEEWFISDYDCYVDGLYEKLGEYENLDELNYLASKLDELDDHDYNHFQAAMQISDYTGSIKDVINLIDNLDKYEIYPGVESNADLGHYYIEELGMMEVPDYLADYIDYEAYGRDVAIKEMDRMGVSHEQLRADALENSPEIRPVVIMGMNEVMKEMMGSEVYEMFGIPDDAEETMYVATVPDKNSGAGVIAYQDFMDQAAERVGGDFFVLPSSINEILLVPDNGDMTADALRDMVKDVNAKEVSPEERLSDNVYHYDSKDHVFELAEKFEARQQEKKTEIDEKAEEKGSVLKDLKDKQKEAAAKPPVKDAAEKAAKTKGGEVL